MARTTTSAAGPRWQRVGKRLLDVIEPDIPRRRALELAVTTRARLRVVLCDDFTFERARGTARHMRALDAAQLLEKALRPRLRVRHGYSGGGAPALSSPRAYDGVGAIAAIDHALFRKANDRSWAYFHGGDEVDVTPEWGLIVQDQALEAFGPSKELPALVRLFERCLRALAGNFVWGYVGIDAVGWPAVAHLRRADTVIRNLLGVALQTTERAGAKVRVYAAIAVGAHGCGDEAGVAAARGVLAKLAEVEERHEALVASIGDSAASAAATRTSTAATKAVIGLMAKLRKRRLGRRGSAVRELPIFASVAAIDAAARTRARKARSR